MRNAPSPALPENSDMPDTVLNSHLHVLGAD
jgi:hypothetical protein